MDIDFIALIDQLFNIINIACLLFEITCLIHAELYL